MDYRDVYYYDSISDVSASAGTGDRTLFTTGSLPVGEYIAWLELNTEAYDTGHDFVLSFDSGSEVLFRKPSWYNSGFVAYCSFVKLTKSNSGTVALIERTTTSPKLQIKSIKLMLMNTKPC